jgi:hypothetical protein
MIKGSQSLELESKGLKIWKKKGHLLIIEQHADNETKVQVALVFWALCLCNVDISPGQSKTVKHSKPRWWDHH